MSTTLALVVIKTDSKLCSTWKCFHWKFLQVFLQRVGYFRVFPFHCLYKFIDCESNSCLKAGTGLTLKVPGTDSLEHQLSVGIGITRGSSTP